MIIVRRFGPDPDFENLEQGRLGEEIFQTWGEAFEYLEVRVGPIDYETRRRAQRRGRTDIPSVDGEERFTIHREK